MAARTTSASDEEKKRRWKSVPLLNEFKVWLDEQAQQVLPKSEVMKAIQYGRGRWASFTRHTEAGMLSMDNNAAENALRAVALGRKNWLFSGSDRGVTYFDASPTSL